MKKKTRLDLGQIELGDKEIVSDPCYTRGTWCHGTVEDLLPGKYNCVITYSDDGSWGERVSQLTVYHESVKPTQLRKGEEAPFTVGVDSGQAGIFCNSIYPEGDTGQYVDKNSFYGACCDATIGEGYHSKQRRFMLENELNHVQEVYDILNECEDKEAVENRLKYHTIRLDMVKKQLAEHVDIPWTKAGLVFGKGVVSSSGYGDGSYRCIIYKKNDEVIGLRIIYI